MPGDEYVYHTAITLAHYEAIMVKEKEMKEKGVYTNALVDAYGDSFDIQQFSPKSFISREDYTNHVKNHIDYNEPVIASFETELEVPTRIMGAHTITIIGYDTESYYCAYGGSDIIKIPQSAIVKFDFCKRNKMMKKNFFIIAALLCIMCGNGAIMGYAQKKSTSKTATPTKQETVGYAYSDMLVGTSWVPEYESDISFDTISYTDSFKHFHAYYPLINKYGAYKKEFYFTNDVPTEFDFSSVGKRTVGVYLITYNPVMKCVEHTRVRRLSLKEGRLVLHRTPGFNVPDSAVYIRIK